MEIIPNTYKLRCELGACKNLATHTIKFSRVGIRSRIHICGACLEELNEATGRCLDELAANEKKEREQARARRRAESAK